MAKHEHLQKRIREILGDGFRVQFDVATEELSGGLQWDVTCHVVVGTRTTQDEVDRVVRAIAALEDSTDMAEQAAVSPFNYWPNQAYPPEVPVRSFSTTLTFLTD